MVKIAITGACGKMGRAIMKLALEDPGIEIVGLVEMKGHPMIGKPHDLMGGKPPVITDDPRAGHAWSGCSYRFHRGEGIPGIF